MIQKINFLNKDQCFLKSFTPNSTFVFFCVFNSSSFASVPNAEAKENYIVK